MNQHLLAEDPEEFEYDDDGNLTKDGRWLYTWDADEARQRGDGAPEACPEGGMNRVPHGRDIPQNRLISMEARADLESDLPRWKYQFTYDYMGRRVQKTSETEGETEGVKRKGVKRKGSGRCLLIFDCVGDEKWQFGTHGKETADSVSRGDVSHRQSRELSERPV